jgi:hypothetical protein
MAGIFDGPKDPKPLPPPPTRSDTDVQQAALDQRRLVGGASGRASTALGGGKGFENTEDDVASKALLGLA